MDPTSVLASKSHMMTVDEASAMLGVRRAQLYALARDGVVPAVRLGRLVRFHRGQLLAWIDSGGAPHPGRTM